MKPYTFHNNPYGHPHMDPDANDCEQFYLASEVDARIAELEGALRDIAGVTKPLDSLEINHRHAVECAREALGL